MMKNKENEIDEESEAVGSSQRITGSSESSLEDLARILEEQVKISEVIVQELEVIKKHIRWQKIWSTLRFFLIIVPILLGLLYGLLYLPPEIKELLDYYSALLRP